jgi:DHA1 family bicyclomycin/chloramphenicol resistance-like MFS transporter
VQLVLSLFLASIALAQIGIGPLSDRFGRRPVLLGGLAVFVAASLMCLAAPGIWSLIALRVVQGAGGCAGIVLGRAIIRDLYDRRQAASMIGYVTMGLAIAPMFAPFIGGVLQEASGWQAVFWAMAGLGALCLAVAWWDIAETNAAPTDRIALDTVLRDFGRLLRVPAFLLFTASLSLTNGVFFAFLGGGPYVCEAILGLSPTEYGAWFALIALGYATGNFLSGRYAERAGVARMILAGSILTSVAVATMTVLFAVGLVAPASLFLPMWLAGTAAGLVLPSATAGAISVRPEIAGAASGLSGAAGIGVGAVLSAVAGAALAGGATASPLFVVMGASTALALVAALAIRRAHV